MPTLTDLPTLFADLPANLASAAQQIFDLEVVTGHLAIPATMEAWAIRHFGDLEALKTQQIIKIYNLLTLEGALFNPLRARRPATAGADDTALARWVADELAHDPFADPLHDTSFDPFGRITGRYCVSASNIAKYDAWHGLVIPTEPDPLRFSQAQIADYLDVALRWVTAAQQADPTARFPLITWNCLPKSGATIVHAHWQIAIARKHPYARLESWRRAAVAYASSSGRNYLADLQAIHQAIGLEVAFASMPAFLHLTPMRNREVVLLMPPETPQQQFAASLYQLLRALIDGLGTRAFNLAIALPPANPTAEWADLPIILRIGDRGPALTTRNDLGTMELYATGVIAEDPFLVAEQIRAWLNR